MADLSLPSMPTSSNFPGIIFASMGGLVSLSLAGAGLGEVLGGLTVVGVGFLGWEASSVLPGRSLGLISSRSGTRGVSLGAKFRILGKLVVEAATIFLPSSTPPMGRLCEVWSCGS